MFGVATGRGSMRRVLKLFKFLVAIPLLGILGLSGWLAFIRPELLPLASAYAAKTVCSNVFIAKRRRGCGDSDRLYSLRNIASSNS